MLKNKLSTSAFVLVLSVVNAVLFHFPFFRFVFENVDYKSLNGIIIVSCLMILMVVFNFFMMYLIFSISRRFGKGLMIILFLCSSVALYFINTFNVILDESMMGNVANTNYQEASGFFSYKIILYMIFFGILPSVFIYKIRIEREKFKRFAINATVAFIVIAAIALGNARNWLWIDKHSKVLGGLLMPWSYTVNLARYHIHQSRINKKEILLPNATITNDKKAVVVLVIGESARRANFSLYGYEKNTNPRLSQVKNLRWFNAKSAATYTTAAVKSILDHKETSKLYEILPNYLFRTGVEVVWRSTNWGEPPIHIKHYQRREHLMPMCQGEGCEYDEVLLAGLKEQILASESPKTLIILHTNTSHGPQYSKRYPPQFEVFKPVCHTVELPKCSQEELLNAYDNSLVYTDYLLSRIIEELQQLDEYDRAMIYVSDHGQSLGEKNLYAHGMPMSIAPKEQYEIPFIVWLSDSTRQLKDNDMLTQYHVFHSVLKFLDIESPVYNENLNIFK